MEKRVEIIYLLVLVFGILTILPYVNAACCLDAGKLCQDNVAGCQNTSVTNCDNLASCKLGCCYNGNQGICSSNSLKLSCSSPSLWQEKPSCDILDCRRGCCILGEKAEFVTEKGCQYLSQYYGLQFNFRSNLNQEACIRLSQVRGACLTSAGCKIVTEAECFRLTGLTSNFYNNSLCTNPSLNTGCQKTSQTRCVDGKDEVYFVDSCGNLANIYDASKLNNADYWNRIYNKTESCGKNLANINSDCGNCDYSRGSKCSVETGTAKCQDLSCKDAPWVVDNLGKIIKTKTRANGEAWCVYDGSVGNETDIVGSRHWRYGCVDRNVLIEPCDDFRQEVCGKIVDNKTFETTQDSEQVRCEDNRWRECLKVTAEVYAPGTSDDVKKAKTLFAELEKVDARNNIRKKCSEIGQCDYYELTLKKTPIVPMCLPKFPGGLDFWNNNSNSKETCSIATNLPYIGTCTKITKCGCVSGCECGTEKWLEEANKICASMGDCGAYVNIVEEVSYDGYKSWIGKDENSSKTKPGPKLVANYTLSLKEFVKKITEENVVVYQKESPVGNLSSFLGKISSGGGGGGIASWFGKIGELLFGSDCPTKKKYYHFTCLPYQPPAGGNDCEKCNHDLKTCSEYRCKSLGQACELLNKGTGNEKCAWIGKNDTSKPVMTPWQEILINASYTKKTCSSKEGCYEISGNDKKCLEPYTNYAIGVKLDEFAQCKLDIEANSSYEDMSSLFDENFYLKEHFLNMSYPSPGHYYEALGQVIDNNYSYYVKCQDRNGNKNQDALRIDFCVDPGEDNNIPRILDTIPRNNAYVAYGLSRIEILFVINEPSECRWSLTDATFEQMTSNFSCDLMPDENEFSYACNATLPLSSKKFFVRCKDQPWLTGENSTKRNAMTTSFVYELKDSQELKITSLSPNSTIISGVAPLAITITARTSGGVDNKASCKWRLNGIEDYFLSTDSSIHTQVLNIGEGDNNIFVNCQDVAGNTASSQVNVILQVDRQAPKITRVYNSGNLKIATDEDSECRYSNSRCSFEWENATEMSGILREHEAVWLDNSIYYIKCKDLYDNKPDNCFVAKTY
ncbi:MAG: hypothetical protein NT076_01125 [Candidatus Pacearchaeota archaeon]|nr:hypothetical protein [Candidatus Pacearchaeota archaeon]